MSWHHFDNGVCPAASTPRPRYEPGQVRLASVRRSLFTSEQERFKFLNRLVAATRTILDPQAGRPVRAGGGALGMNLKGWGGGGGEECANWKPAGMLGAVMAVAPACTHHRATGSAKWQNVALTSTTGHCLTSPFHPSTHPQLPLPLPPTLCIARPALHFLSYTLTTAPTPLPRPTPSLPPAHPLTQGLAEHDNFHELCRLLGRLKTNYQLSELVGGAWAHPWSSVLRAWRACGGDPRMCCCAPRPSGPAHRAGPCLPCPRAPRCLWTTTWSGSRALRS